MREMFIVTAEGISKEDLEKFCKRKDPQAEVLQDRKDMVATYWEPDDVREYYEYDTGDAVSLTDKECISLLVDALGCAPYSAGGAEYCCWHDLDAAMRDGPIVPTAIIPADFEGGLPIVLCGAIAFTSAGVDGRPASLGPGDCAEIMRQLLADQPRLKEYISRMEDFARRTEL